MKIKKIQQIKVYFVNDDSPQWFWIEPFTDFSDKWILTYDGESDELSSHEIIHTDNICNIYFERRFRTFKDGKRDYEKDNIE